MANTQLRQQGVDRANLHAGATAAISQFRSVDVIASIGDKERQGVESQCIAEAFG